MPNTITASACDNELVIIAFNWSKSFYIGDIQSGNGNPVALTINLHGGNYSGPMSYNSVNGAPVTPPTYDVYIPADTYSIMVIGVNWGATAAFAASVNGVALDPSTIQQVTGVAWTPSPVQNIVVANSNIINTIAGNGTMGYSGDGGPATSAELGIPSGVAVDAAGNTYIAETQNNRIRMVTPAGIISTFAGNGTAGFSGDGGPATSAEINFPTAVAVDGSGNIYIADGNNHRIRRVNPQGVISTFAGSGSGEYSGDGGPATSAGIFPEAVAADTAGNIYISDITNFRIRKVNTSGIISTYAGNGTFGYSGDGGQATAAQMKNPYGVAADVHGNVYFADPNNYVVRMINPAGIISNFAGNGTAGNSGDGGPAIQAALANPAGVCVDAGANVYIVDNVSNNVRTVDTSGIINSYAGTGISGFAGDGGPALNAQFNGSDAVTVDSHGSVYVVDENNQRIRKITPGS